MSVGGEQGCPVEAHVLGKNGLTLVPRPSSVLGESSTERAELLPKPAVEPEGATAGAQQSRCAARDCLGAFIPVGPEKVSSS